MRRLVRLSRYAYFVIAVSLIMALLVLANHTANGTNSASANPEQKQSTLDAAQRTISSGWQRGKIEGAFLVSSSLNPLVIGVQVEDDRATLTGSVSTHVQKDLAQEIALSVEGIERVSNQLEVDPNTPSYRERGTDLAENLTDSAITARVKTKLLANINVPGNQITVETLDKEVTLSGRVDSQDEQQLAYYLTRNTPGIAAVHNRIEVDPAR